jgi:hypothetical protein
MDLIALVISLTALLGVFVVVCYDNFISETRKWLEFFHELSGLTGLEM